MSVKQITRKQLVTKARKTQRGGSTRFPSKKTTVDARATQGKINRFVFNVKTNAEAIESLYFLKHNLVELKDKANEWGATVKQSNVTRRASDITNTERKSGTPLQLIEKLETAVKELRTFMMELPEFH